jgi:hypothetical protein
MPNLEQRLKEVEDAVHCYFSERYGYEAVMAALEGESWRQYVYDEREEMLGDPDEWIDQHIVWQRKEYERGKRLRVWEGSYEDFKRAEGEVPADA